MTTATHTTYEAALTEPEVTAFSRETVLLCTYGIDPTVYVVQQWTDTVHEAM